MKDQGMVSPADALPGREQEMPTGANWVDGKPLRPPFPQGIEVAYFAMGCFWGAERQFRHLPGIYTTAVGYAGGLTANPDYEEVSSGRTAHAETVMVAFDPGKVSYQDLLRVFWEGHDPTQGMRQGADVGTQYRSAIFTTTPAQMEQALRSRDLYQQALTTAGRGRISTEIRAAGPFFYAEDYHQQYLAKNPAGYCGLGGTEVRYPVGAEASGP